MIRSFRVDANKKQLTAIKAFLEALGVSYKFYDLWMKLFILIVQKLIKRLLMSV